MNIYVCFMYNNAVMRLCQYPFRCFFGKAYYIMNVHVLFMDYHLPNTMGLSYNTVIVDTWAFFARTNNHRSV